jgi:hypothetical protein
LQVPGGLAFSDSEKAEALADSLEAQFQPVNDPSDPAVIEMVNEAMQAYEYAPASEPKLTSPSEVQQAIRQIHEDLGIPLFTDHIRALTESSDSKIADAGNLLFRQLGRHLCRPRAD